MTAGALLARRRVAEALWILFFAHEALASTRHVPVFVTVCGPLIAMQLTVWWRALSEHASKNSIRHIVNSMSADAAAAFRRTSVWPAAVLLALILIGKPIPWPEDFPDLVFPANMVHRHEADILGVRTLTTDQWADYLIYLNPRQKVFVDGRSDFYGPEIGDQYLRFTNAQWDWRDTLEKNHFQTILLPVELPIIQLLKLQPDWRVVEDDGKRILLVHTDTSVPSTGFTRPEPRF
jgi:hypothetical protein